MQTRTSSLDFSKADESQIVPSSLNTPNRSIGRDDATKLFHKNGRSRNT